MKPDRDASPDCRAAGESVILRGCGSSSRRCMGSATTSSSSTPPAPRVPHAGAVAPARRPPHRHRLRPGPGARAAAQPGHRCLLPHLQRRRPRGRAMRQRRALHRALVAPAQCRVASARCVLGQPGGVVDAVMRDDGLVSVAMGVPDFDPRSLPFEARGRSATSIRSICRREPVEIGAVSIGNPHAVIRVRVGGRRAGGHRRTRHRESRALPAPRERRLHGDRVDRSTSGCGYSSAARARPWPAAPAPAPRSRSAAGTARSTRRCGSTLPGGRLDRTAGVDRASRSGSPARPKRAFEGRLNCRIT